MTLRTANPIRAGEAILSGVDRTGGGLRNSRRSAAFTLIELILVMALLIIVISVSAPSLSRFFKGRALEAEAQRLASLARYGQSRAVSEGIPMVLWIDLTEKTYALREDETFTIDRAEDPLAVEYELAPDLEFDLPEQRWIQNGRALIRFLPDGSFDPKSFEMLQIKDSQEDSLWVMRSENRLYYEVRADTNTWQQARR